VTDQRLDLACDRLSTIVDGVQFERLRWDRTEGPMFARLVALAHAALESRPDFDLVEEGMSRDEKRFVLKIHANRIVAFSITLDGTRAVMCVEPIERGKYAVTAGPPVVVEFAQMDEAMMARSLEHLFSRIQPLAV
jgi:hypothetical protein